MNLKGILLEIKMYKNIRLTKKVNKANCVTHSGKFHVDDIISTIFLSKIMKKVILIRVPSVENINLENKASPDFIKYCNPEWNEEMSEDKAFLKALKLADEFWKVYIKHAIAEVDAMEIVSEKIKNCKDCYLIFEKEMPYKKAIKLYNTGKIRYIIFKSRREGYDIRAVSDSCKFKDEISQTQDISISRKLTGVNDLIYVDVHGRLCCTKTLNGALKIIEYNEK